jgi:hypothetical protein
MESCGLSKCFGKFITVLIYRDGNYLSVENKKIAKSYGFGDFFES